MLDFEQMFSLLERIDPQYRQYKKILNEGVETKNMSAAKHYLYDKMKYNEQQAMKVIGSIKHDIPNSRLAKCKFMLGLVRMYSNGELNRGDIITKLNQTLEYVASDRYVNNFNQDLNGLSCTDLIRQFEETISQDIIDRKNNLSQEEFINNTDYNIVKINSFEEARQYEDYTNWCIVEDEKQFDDCCAGGVFQFYFCLRKGFENEEKVMGNDCPLDRYGLSMIAVSIRPDGSINTCTCRWNHNNGGNNNILNDNQLSKLLGVNIYNVLKPKSKEEAEENLINAINNGECDLIDVAVGHFIIPNGVRNIGYMAFSSCDALTNITIPNSVNNISSHAFEYCTNLKKVVLPENIMEIGDDAFYGCTSLDSIVINASPNIGVNAFGNCPKLTIYVDNEYTFNTIKNSGFNGNIEYIK